jgi:hypothetical protein
LVGGQSVPCALASSIYPTQICDTGGTVAFARYGSILGPFIAGQLMALGQDKRSADCAGGDRNNARRDAVSWRAGDCGRAPMQ